MQSEKSLLSPVGKLLITIAFADSNRFLGYYRSQSHILFLHSARGAQLYFSDHNFEKVSLLHIAKMSLDLWSSLRERVEILPFQMEDRYQHALWIYDYIAVTTGQTEPFELDYASLSRQPPFNHIEWEWEWLNFEKERPAMVAAGIREIDIQLYNAVLLRQRELVLDLLKKGANPYVNLQDDEQVYLGTLFDHLQMEEILEDHHDFRGWLVNYYMAKRPPLSDEEREARKDPYWAGLHEAEDHYHPALDWNNLLFEEDVEPILQALFVGASAEVMKQLCIDNSQHPQPENPVLAPHQPAFRQPEAEEPEIPKPERKPVTITFGPEVVRQWEESLANGMARAAKYEAWKKSREKPEE
jgi:hypothetical protein